MTLNYASSRYPLNQGVEFTNNGARAMLCSWLLFDFRGLGVLKLFSMPL
jgi:hypothetical protein